MRELVSVGYRALSQVRRPGGLARALSRGRATASFVRVRGFSLV